MSINNYISFDDCVCCGLLFNSPNCFHHLYTRKAHPSLKDEPKNLVSVCLRHHNEFHNQGINYMSLKYKNFFNWLVLNNWEYDSNSKKWVNYELLKKEND